MNSQDTLAASEDFERSERSLREYRAIIALSLGVALMPLGLIPDWVLYRDAFASLFVVRIVSTVILAIGLTAILRMKLKRSFEPISFFLIYSPAVAMAMMMYLTDGGRSTYYFGLILLMIVVHLLGIRTGEAVLFCLLTVVAYLAAVITHSSAHQTSQADLTQGVFFLSTSAIVCICVSHFSRKNRWVAFQLQRELRNERTQLKQSMQKLRETESQLLQSEKVRAVAGLASGLLHEINNPVNFSLMAVRVLKKRLAGKPSELETLGDIEEGVGRIGSIVSDLRSFAYPEEMGSMKPFALRHAIDTAIRFSVNEAESGTICVVDSPTMNSTVLAMEGQIVQVLLNLIVNSSRAIRKKVGALKRIQIEAKTMEDRVAVVLRDWGVGISDEKLKTLMDSNTIQRTDEGLGLGLSICRRIIQSHGGQLTITSQLGEGTQVTFDLARGQGPGMNKSAGTDVPMKQNRLLDHEGAAQ